MATKKQKREAAEAKRKAFLEQVKAEGLAAQKADRERAKKREEVMDAVTSGSNQRHRSILLKNGINPSTGLLFTDEEMEEMKKKAGRVPERRHLYHQIEAGRERFLKENTNLGKVTLGDLRSLLDSPVRPDFDEQPPLNMSDYTSDI